MKKYKIYFFSGAIIASMMCFGGCSSDNSSESSVLSEEQQAENDTFFEITDLINAGDYENALALMEERYKDTVYSEVDGMNKMNQYRLYYNAQGMYDESISVIFDFIIENGYTPDSTDSDYEMAVGFIEDIIDSVSDENKLKAAELTGIEVSLGIQDSAAESSAAQSSSSALSVTAGQMIDDYNSNTFSADQKYKGKSVQVTGSIYSIESTDDGGALVKLTRDNEDIWEDIWCYVYDSAELQKVAELVAEQTATIEGICEGDDFFIEMSNCKVIQ